MKATVTSIESGRIDVRTRDGREYGLDTFRRPELHAKVKVGDSLIVERRENSPFLYLSDGSPIVR